MNLLKPFAIVLVGLALCAADKDTAARDRLQVSDELRKRTGQGLRPPGQEAGLPLGVSLTEPLSEEAAVAIALWNNAALQAALSELGLARADLIEAGSFRNPSVQLLFPVGPKPFESVFGWPVETLWQRPRRMAAARLNLETVCQRVVQHGLNLVRDARVAYAELALAERRSALLGESGRLLERIAELSGKRLAAGDISAMEANLAVLEARSASELAARAAREVEVARERLRLLLGLRKDASPLRTAEAREDAPSLPAWTELLEAALASRISSST